MPEAAAIPCVHIVEDEEGLREARMRFFEGLNLPVRGYASGEAFLDVLTVDTRGVVSMDIDLRKGGGRLDGCEVFERMLHLGSHLPVSFLTGPFANHRRLCIDMVTRRSHVDYFGKDEPVRLVNDQMLAYLNDEPALYEKARRERWLLQLVCVAMTHGERDALDGTYRGLSAAAWAEEIGAFYRTLQQQVAAGVRRYTGTDRLAGSNLDAIRLLRELAPLMERLQCRSLQALAARELARRLTLADVDQQRALHRVLTKARGLHQEPAAQRALALMALDDAAMLRDLLKNAAFNLQGLMLPRLPAETHALVRHWLDWLSRQPGAVPWEALPLPEPN